MAGRSPLGSLLGIAMLCATATCVRAALAPSATALMLFGGAGSAGIIASANNVLDALDRPQAAHKINIHGDSSDDSSDDDDDDSEDRTCLKRNRDGSCQVTSNVQHFRNDFGQIEIKWSSCNDPYEDGDHEDFEEVAVESSLYQKIIFEENLKAGDKCLRLDNTLQQCSSYRPHYHEPFVHPSASYLNAGMMSGVKLVVFVGGGDSMLLHEVLKYDGLEMVLGLELDQMVTRNSFEHFKTQPHFDDPRVQWWFGDGAKSLTLLPRSYFGTFDLVLLDLSETVMSMTVTKGLDVFGAMKLLLGPKGILVKNDYGYFEKLAKVFDTCLQLLMQDVTYICDYELVLCASDSVNLLSPTFDHLEGVGEGRVKTLVYRPQDDIDNHWGPVTDYSKYWGEPRKCPEERADDGINEESVAYAGVLMIVEAENVSVSVGDAEKVVGMLETPLSGLGYSVLSTISQPSGEGGGVMLAISMKEGYVLLESWPDAKYCKLDIHLWGGFERQDEIRSELLKTLGTAPGDWQSYRIVTGGMRGAHTRSSDLKTVGPDLARIGQCEPVEEGSAKAITHNSSYDDEAALGPVIDAGLNVIIDTMIGKSGINPVVFCGVKGTACRAKTNLETQGFSNLITLWSCSPEEEKEMDSSAYNRGIALQKWRESIAVVDAKEFSLCGKKADVALKEISKKVQGINLVVVDALAPSQFVIGSHDYWLKFWKSIKKPSLLLVPILDKTDQVRTFLLKSRYNHADIMPDYYSEIYVGDGTKTMSFGMIHAGTSKSLLTLMRAQAKLDEDDAVKFTDIRKVTIRGAMRAQNKYNPVTFSWNEYDQRPGLEQFYGQRPVGLQGVYQFGSTLDGKTALSSSDIKMAFTGMVQKLDSTWTKTGTKEAFHEIGEGALFVTLTPKGQVAVTWDGAASIVVNIFTYDETANHYKLFLAPFLEGLSPIMKFKLMLKDEMPRGYGKVINKSKRVNRDESPDCYDHYKLCPALSEKGNCEGNKGAKEWMKLNCMFSCNHCDRNNSFAKTEL
jgi:spermidine synthase